MKYAIVTGGTSGIGKQITIDLLKDGYFVFITYANNYLRAKVCQEELEIFSSSFCIIKADFQQSSEIEKFSNLILQKTDTLDCYIGNAGKTTKKPFQKISNEEWENDFRVNIHSNLYILRNLNNILANNANIIFIGSLMGQYPHGTSLSYGVSKAALHSLAINLVKVFSDREIRVNVISPGFVETDWQKGKPKEIRNNIINKTALKRFAIPEEISNACMFLIKNKFVNGEVLNINGGYCFQ
jgi:3-oxoacyl-[acyl-carrier protein] reductase